MITKTIDPLMKEVATAPMNSILRRTMRPGTLPGLPHGGCAPNTVRRRVLVAFATISLASSAWAQPATPPVPVNPETQPNTPKLAAPNLGAKVEEITVTSQKRKENVRKVPLSVTVLSGKQLRAAHIENFADLTRSVPNLSFSSQAGEGLSNLEIRGISSSAGTATVALYLDDVSLTTRNLPTEGAVEPRFLDISRLEVLRGPQSTLYGAWRHAALHQQSARDG
jgi:iron complex outermembrane receptor protein